ncbi:OmpP1/FadL family transporter [Endozoicomonas arenosclerae]|uniref:OmpP1/FadL family transporter n=1 Tax=Endozoicomonas arenosclerae TaxID=1633495 RepID=UPI0007841F3B|nr:outer membrane protein transport protein [Endozoicomonas arenosclerae]
MTSHTRSSRFFLVSSLAVAVSAGNAVAGGFEKATLWDAQYSALAGAAVSSVDDSSAIFFNPAGMAFAESNDIALHVSPTFTTTNGPAAGDNTFIDGETNFSPVGGLTGLFKLNDKFTMGYGVYAAGGASSKYEDVTVGNDRPITGDYSTDIQVIEAGLGLAYRINNNWSVGGTYRLTYATADINMLSATDINLGPISQNVGGSVGYNDMSGFNTFGVRLGAMFRSDDNRWGWGINYRSEVDIEADGDASYKNGLGAGEYNKVDATAKTALPMQISTGVDYQVAPNWTLFGEITYSEYSNNEQIKFESDDTALAVPAINANWEDQYNYRIAAEYTGIENWALRAGYIYTTAVVTEEYAAPTFSTPANAHSFTFGAGTTILDGQVDLDFAAEYNMAENDSVKGGGDLSSASKSHPGKYESNAYAIHATVKYKF